MKVDAQLLHKVILFVTEKHKGQKRKISGDDYVIHPLEVAISVLAIKGSNNPYLITIVSLLHDVVEDCDVEIEEIASLFGFQVASIVLELTTNKEMCKVMGKTKYLAHKMLNMSSYALRIKLADRLRNVDDIKLFPEPEKIKKTGETLAILKTLKGRKLTKTHKILIKQIKQKLR